VSLNFLLQWSLFWIFVTLLLAEWEYYPLHFLMCNFEKHSRS
jgi:hypothetical protein